MANEALPATPTGPARRSEHEVDPREAQFLATEHWSLLATRSLSWNEAFSRTGMFLSTLSAATVALALVGPATSFGSEFAVFAIVILSVTLFLGVATFVRLVQVNNEDLYWVAGMNRLRGAYVRLVPGIEREFAAGWTLDNAGISRSFGALDVIRGPAPLHMIVTTPAVVGIVSSAILGVMAGLVAIQVTSAMGVAVVVGIAAFAVGIAALMAFTIRDHRGYVARMLAEEMRRAERLDQAPEADG